MRLAITGGGTGGHIYPALEVARFAAERGSEILYLGSLRGQEGEICRQRGILFQGFASEPLYSLKTPKGWKAVAALLRATNQAKAALRAAKPDAVFSTGGYSAAPVMAAARSLGIPYTIHEANSVPGRSNRMFAPKATAFTCSFHATAKHIENAIRTGHPIRKELRENLQAKQDDGRSILVLGGSQGSAFLNEMLPKTADLLGPDIRVTHAVGKANYQSLESKLRLGDSYKIVPYLETPEIVRAYVTSSIAVARSGSTVAEFALFGLPSVLVPLPTSADDHQRENAKEFVALGGADIVEQEGSSEERFAETIKDWLDNAARRKDAAKSLQAWDIPGATEQIVDILLRAAVRPT